MIARLATPADDALLTSIVMHPDVHRSNGAGEFNPAEYTAHPTNFAVVVDGGCFMAQAIERASYCIHTNFLPGSRGAAAMEAAAQALWLTFTETNAEALYTVIDEDNRSALWFAHAMGFKNSHHSDGRWFLRMDIEDWIVASAGLASVGEEIHGAIEQAGHLTHATDPVHDAFVGAAYLMLTGIQYEKAERIYGRWARIAGYRPIEFISADPVRIDIGDCVIRINGRHFIIEDKQCPPLAQA